MVSHDMLPRACKLLAHGLYTATVHSLYTATVHSLYTATVHSLYTALLDIPINVGIQRRRSNRLDSKDLHVF